MSDYRVVSTLHAARVTLSDLRKAVVAAEADVAAARAAVDAALANGRVTSAAHLLDLDLDCLGAVLSHLGPDDALSTARTCTTLRSALFRGGLPWPLAAVCKRACTYHTAANAAPVLRALDGMEPALGALRLDFLFTSFNEGHARVLARALDAAPRAARIDITLTHFYNYRFFRDQIIRLADVLSSPDRMFATPPQVHVRGCDSRDTISLLHLTRAGVCVASIGDQLNIPSAAHNFIARFAASAAKTLTELQIIAYGSVNLTTPFPALRRLILAVPGNFTTDTPSLTALAPHLKEIEILNDRISNPAHPPSHGFGFEPRLFARFVAAIQGVTRVRFGPGLSTRLSQNENENLRQLTALHTLLDLEISYDPLTVVLVPRPSCPDPPRAPVAEDVITNLPPLAPGLTRLVFSGSTRVAFGHPLPELRVLDWRRTGGATHFFNQNQRGHYIRVQPVDGQNLLVRLAVPSAAIAPNLHTLLIGSYCYVEVDLWALVAARTALRVVVIEHARLLCSASAGFDTTTAGFAALLARDAKDLVSVHTHDCEIEGGHELAVENFLHGLEQRGGRVCRAGVKECLFCMLHDGTDLWPRR